MGWPRTPQLGLSVGPTWQGHRLMAPAVGRIPTAINWLEIPQGSGRSGSNEAPPSALLHERQFNLVRYSQSKTGTGCIPAHTISIRETAGKGSYFTSTERRSLLDVARDGAKQLEQRSGFHLLGDIGATEQLMGRRHRAPGRPSCEQVVSNTSGASKGRGAGRWAA